VDAHDGRIDVRVLEAGGTRFRVTLPVTGSHQLFDRRVKTGRSELPVT